MPLPPGFLQSLFSQINAGAPSPTGGAQVAPGVMGGGVPALAGSGGALAPSTLPTAPDNSNVQSSLNSIGSLMGGSTPAMPGGAMPPPPPGPTSLTKGNDGGGISAGGPGGPGGLSILPGQGPSGMNMNMTGGTTPDPGSDPISQAIIQAMGQFKAQGQGQPAPPQAPRDESQEQI